jgi:hypothetical protein
MALSPSGLWPEGRLRATFVEGHGFGNSLSCSVPVGESPTGTGGSPVPPVPGGSGYEMYGLAPALGFRPAGGVNCFIYLAHRSFAARQADGTSALRGEAPHAAQAGADDSLARDCLHEVAAARRA